MFLPLEFKWAIDYITYENKSQKVMELLPGSFEEACPETLLPYCKEAQVNPCGKTPRRGHT